MNHLWKKHEEKWVSTSVPCWTLTWIRVRGGEKVLMDFSWKCLLFRGKTILDPCLLADVSIFEIYGQFRAVSSWL